MQQEADDASFVVPCRTLDARAPFRWLALGWRDLRRTPALSALFGLATVAVSLLVSWLAWTLGRFALLAVLLSGFVFVAPLLGVAMYAVSRSLLEGQQPSLRTSLQLARRVLGQAGVFALIQLVLMLLWSRAGMMLTVFVPLHQGDSAALLEYLLIGSLVGSVFAALTFAVAVLSLPLIADRDVDMVTACISSVNAVLRNKGVMALWALLIVVLTALGFATAFIGLGIAMPWLAYASFHACRDTLDGAS
ncbi:MAG TPA: DUF2189 domain-containing protein [Thermomonas sp.]|nr:DUF2189 domain-containing protein [Thermomonas sp.]